MSGAIELPTFPVSGGCQCGDIRYRLSAPPLVVYFCHCTECQTQSASAFGQSMRVESEHLSVDGDVATFFRDDGQAACDFCPDCGVRLFHRRAQYADRLNIKAGTLDDTSWLRPAGHIWTRSRQAGVIIEDDALAFTGQPDDGFAALEMRWTAMIARD